MSKPGVTWLTWGATGSRQHFTLPHASWWSPGRLHGLHVDSAWIPGKMSQKGNFHSGILGILVESMLIPGSFLVESRTRISVIICMESMESVWIPHGFQTELSKRKRLHLKSSLTTWNPWNLYGFHMDSRQNYPKEKIQ
jgi:hypothetical protein